MSKKKKKFQPFLTLLMLAALCLQWPVSERHSWRQGGWGPTKTFYNSEDHQMAPPLEFWWEATTPGGYAFGQHPIEGNYAYACGYEGLQKLDLLAKSVLWTQTAAICDDTPWPAVDDVRVYGADWNGSLWSVDKNTGQLAWSVEILSPTLYSIGFYAPVLYETRVYYALDWWKFPNSDAVTVTVTARDVSTGGEVWTRNLITGTLAFSSNPIYAGGKIIEATDTAGVYALDPDDGDVLWHYEHPTGAEYCDVGYHLPPTSDGQRVYFSCSWLEDPGPPRDLYSQLIAVNVADGSEAWRRNLDHPTEPDENSSTLMPYAGYLYWLEPFYRLEKVDEDQYLWEEVGFTLHKLDPANGSTVSSRDWFHDGAYPSMGYQALVGANGYAYVQGLYWYAWDLSSLEEVWVEHISDWGADFPPTLADGWAIAAQDGYSLYIYKSVEYERCERYGHSAVLSLSDKSRALLRFHVRGLLPDDAKVTSAFLHLYLVAASGKAEIAYISELNALWGEATTDWCWRTNSITWGQPGADSVPTDRSGEVLASFSTAKSGWQIIGLPPELIEQWRDTEGAVPGLIIYSDSLSSPVALSSREWYTSEYAPRLEIYYTR